MSQKAVNKTDKIFKINLLILLFIGLKLDGNGEYTPIIIKLIKEK
jgi:hypothetical protein